MPFKIFPTAEEVISPEEIRDALLSLPNDERIFIITTPLPGEKKVYSIVRDGDTGEIAINCSDNLES